MHTQELTVEQCNFCQAVESMRKAMRRKDQAPAWLVAYPGVITRVWGEMPGTLCGLNVAEAPWCPPGAFYLVDDDYYRSMSQVTMEMASTA